MRQRIELENLGNQILSEARTDLYLSMRFMGSALNSLGFTMDLSTRTVGTDAVSIRYNPSYLMQLFADNPRRLNRTYMHMLMHCLFRHMFSAGEHEQEDLWDLSCDIAVESIIDTMHYSAIERVLSDFRQEWYERLTAEIHVLSAEKIYQYFIGIKRDFYLETKLKQEFSLCDHSFWQRMCEEETDGGPGQSGPGSSAAGQDPDQSQQSPENKQGSSGTRQSPDSSQNPFGDQPSPNDKQQSPTETPNSANQRLAPPQDPDRADEEENATPVGSIRQKEEEWKKNAKRIHSELETYARERSEDSGSLERMLAFTCRKRRCYREFLDKFMILREEGSIDMDSFDYGFYHYGMEMYGNMPLIEENEFREIRKIDELVIAIDTSASCQKGLVERFLNETASILLSREHFFHKVNIHILECDNRVQKDVQISNVEEMEKYAAGFQIKGGYGTDFRPVFAYVERLIAAGKLKNLKGLMYFTDGFGTYPTRPTPYDTAFVFWKDEEMDDAHVPDWAVKLYLDQNTR